MKDTLPMPNMDQNEILFERARAVIPGGVNSPVRAFKAVGGTPRFVKRAQGAYFWDADDKRYIDYIGSWGPMILGHGHPAVVEAVQRAVTEGFSFGAPTEREIELAEAILGAGAVDGDGAPGELGHRGRDERAAPGAVAPPAASTSSSSKAATTAMPTPCWSRPARPRDLRQPDLGRRAARGGAAHAGARVQQPGPAGGSLRAARPRDRLPDDRGDRRQHELRARQRGLRASAAASCARSTARCWCSTR